MAEPPWYPAHSYTAAVKQSLQVGQRASVNITVTEDMCPAFDGTVVHRVYSTWSMAHHMELAARKVLAPYLEPDEEGIGSHLTIARPYKPTNTAALPNLASTQKGAVDL